MRVQINDFSRFIVAGNLSFLTVLMEYAGGLYDGYVYNICDNNKYRGSCTRCLRWSTFDRNEGILDVWKR